MTFVSYAQNKEDIILWKALKTVEHGTYIDLGAAWPTFHNVTKAFYDRGWNGINIEPNPTLLSDINLERVRDTNLGVAVSDHSGEIVINVMSNAGLSTADADVAASHVESGFENDPVTVPLTTLAAICGDHLEADQPIHFLKVDIEGLEEPALRGHDWERFRPWIVVVEAMEPMSQVENHHAWEPILLGADYVYVYSDGLNRYYVAKEKHTELAPSFQYPPNIFDDYMSVERQTALIGCDQLQATLTQVQSQKSALESQKAALERNMAMQAVYRGQRSTLGRVLFDSENGRPTRLVRRALFHKSGRCRGLFRRLVLHTSGQPRRPFVQWMTSDLYNALPAAHTVSASDHVGNHA